MPTRHVGTCVKCGRIVTVDVDGLGRPWVAAHRTVGRTLCSGSGAPPRGYIATKNEEED